ncbi:hypothetical protein BD413DRAFT_228052 [Trametes elegans]|nr:hypothetical protein BD413DRAFT_228052 [Trametes elegans]
MAATALSSQQLDTTLGAWLLGTFFGLLLQGAVYLQAFRYYRKYPNDPRYLKIWVAIVLFLETFNTALTMHSCYTYLVTNFANPSILVGRPVWSMWAFPLTGSLTSLVCEAFFARRAWMMGGSRYRVFIVFAAMCWLAFFGFYAALTITSFRIESLPESLKLSWLASTGSTIKIGGDIIVTAVLIYTLQKSRSGVARTDTILDLLILYALSTGLIIAVFTVVNVALVHAFPHNLIYAIFAVMLTKLYANSFLVALNTRQYLVQRGLMTEQETTPFHTIVWRVGRGSTTTGATATSAASRSRGLSQVSFTAASPRSPAEPRAPIELKMVPVLGPSDDGNVGFGPRGTPRSDVSKLSLQADDDVEAAAGH